MNYTQNAKIAQVNEKALVIGVDVGSETHYARAFNWRGQELSKKAFHFSNGVEGYLAFAKWLDGYRRSMDAEKIYVGCEPTGHYWFNFAREGINSCVLSIFWQNNLIRILYCK